MQVKTYRGKSPEECFKMVKQELGLDAVILQSRSLQNMFGKFGAMRHEVVAAIDVTIPADKSPTGVELRRPLTLSSGRVETANSTPVETASGTDEERYDRLERQLSALTANMNSFTPSGKNGGIVRGKPNAPEVDQYGFLKAQLLESGVAEPLIKRIFAQIPVGLSDAAASAELRVLITSQLRITPRFEMSPGTTRLVAFVGGTGVGKTTTIAKMAAQLALREKRNIGIISMDTHRVAAAKQLQTYGEILGVPVKIAYDKKELEQYLGEFAAEKKDAVLVDTAGRSPNDSSPISDMAVNLRGFSSIYTYLVVPASLSAKNFENSVEQFHMHLSANAMIMTKLDEAVDNTCLGHVLNVQAKTGIPLAYFTNGQRVPDDMVTADANAITARLLSPSIL